MFATTRSIGVTNRVASCPARQHRQSIGRCYNDNTAYSQVPRSRREGLLTIAGLSFLALAESTPPAMAVKLPPGFNVIQDKSDGYQYLVPYGWQPVDIEGQDSAYKDLIEPLESVSVTLFPINKKTIKEFGPLNEVAYTLADKVLTPASQEVKILNTTEREVEGIPYYSFEFETQAPNYKRHALAVIAVGNGNFYTLLTGSSEMRFNKLEERLRIIAKSFQIIQPVDV